MRNNRILAHICFEFNMLADAKSKTPLLSGRLNRCGKDQIYINKTENKILFIQFCTGLCNCFGRVIFHLQCAAVIENSKTAGSLNILPKTEEAGYEL